MWWAGIRLPCDWLVARCMDVLAVAGMCAGIWLLYDRPITLLAGIGWCCGMVAGCLAAE